MGNLEQLYNLLIEFEEISSEGEDITHTLIKLAEMFELETSVYLKQDPDPFDNLLPVGPLGEMLTALSESNGILFDRIVDVYSQYDNVELKTAACRFLLSLFPVYDSGFYFIFSNESFILTLFQWAESAPCPLTAFATGLLSEAMKMDFATSYKEKNNQLIPLKLMRLYELSNFFLRNLNWDGHQFLNYLEGQGKMKTLDNSGSEHFSSTRKVISKKRCNYRYNPMSSGTKSKENKCFLNYSPIYKDDANECSNANWSDVMFGTHPLFSSTESLEQNYILKYLTTMGECTALLGYAIRETALELTMRYIDIRQNQDLRLAFDALQYLSCLLRHKKLAMQFLELAGLQILLAIPRPSIASSGVSVCLYQLGKIEVAMEKISIEPNFVISGIVSYSLWLLECSHKSSKCHAAKFLRFGFAFGSLLNEFDHQGGLRKLLNVISTLNVFEGTHRLRYKSTIKYVCASINRYFKAHLAVLVQQKLMASNTQLIHGVSQSEISTLDSVERNMEILHDLGFPPLFYWIPVNEFSDLDGITLLLKLVSSYSQYRGARPHSGRIDIIQNSLDILQICALTVSTQLKLCEEMSNVHDTGMSILLKAAEGQLFPAVTEVQLSALLTITNCVCTRMPTVKSNCKTNSALVTGRSRCIKNLLHKVWNAVKIKNGIHILIKLLSIKNSSVDAYSVRTLACKALCGLAQSETVKHILRKLPLITDDQLISLINETVSQDKYHCHVKFCQYCFKLIERITGISASYNHRYNSNSNDTCVSEVWKKTKRLHYENQHLQLMSNHLSQKGLIQTDSRLERDTGEESTVSTKSCICLKDLPSVYNISWQKSLKKFSRATENLCKTLNVSQASSFTSSALTFSSPSKVLDKNIPNLDVKFSTPMPQDAQSHSSNRFPSSIFLETRPQEDFLLSTDKNTNLLIHSTGAKYLENENYLRKNPIHSKTAFSLFMAHNRLKSNFQKNAPLNLFLQSNKRKTCFQKGILNAALHTKYIFSRFRLHRICKDETLRNPTKCAFVKNTMGCGQKLLIGTNSGEVKIFNVSNGKQVHSKSCHDRRISHIESRKSTPFLITSSCRDECSKLWKTNPDMEIIHSFDRVFHMEFSKRSSDRVIGTRSKKAVIYDVNTFSKLQSFSFKNMGHNYGSNTATLDYSDDLVLTDGLLYGTRSGKMLHKFEKFNSNWNGVFHPNGREIISNSEVWDIRTFKLLRTVAGLNQCMITFNQPSSVIYAARQHGIMNCFYTFDAFGYNIISTVDVGRPVYHLDCDLNDRYVATVVASSTGFEQVCRLYEVGRIKLAGDDSGDDTDADSENNIEEMSSEDDAEAVNQENNEEDDDEQSSENDEGIASESNEDEDEDYDVESDDENEDESDFEDNEETENDSDDDSSEYEGIYDMGVDT